VPSKKIKEEFQKERNNIQYVRDYHFVGKGGVTSEKNYFLRRLLLRLVLSIAKIDS